VLDGVGDRASVELLDGFELAGRQHYLVHICPFKLTHGLDSGVSRNTP
jgi:hypothetical protein